MKFKGKIGLWWLITIIFINVLFIYSMLVAKTMIGRGVLIVILLVTDIFMLSWTFNNYVELNDDCFTIHFGFSKNKVKYKDVTKISKTNSMIAGSATSFDRLLIETDDEKIIISLKEKESFISELMKRNSEVIIK